MFLPPVISAAPGTAQPVKTATSPSSVDGWSTHRSKDGRTFWHHAPVSDLRFVKERSDVSFYLYCSDWKIHVGQAGLPQDRARVSHVFSNAMASKWFHGTDTSTCIVHKNRTALAFSFHCLGHHRGALRSARLFSLPLHVTCI